MDAIFAEVMGRLLEAPDDEAYTVIWEVPPGDMEQCKDGMRARQGSRTLAAIHMINTVFGASLEAVTIERKDQTGWALMVIRKELDGGRLAIL